VSSFITDVEARPSRHSFKSTKHEAVHVEQGQNHGHEKDTGTAFCHRKAERFVPNLSNKNNYVSHYLDLQFYVNRGLIVRKMYRTLSFSKGPARSRG